MDSMHADYISKLNLKTPNESRSNNRHWHLFLHRQESQ